MLKDWKNVRKSKGISTWKNIKKEKLYGKTEYLWINDTGHGYTVTYGNDVKLFDNKSQALRFARSYMRKH